MFLPSQPPATKTLTEVPAIVRKVSRGDVQWGRKLFRPPALVVRLQPADFSGLGLPTKPEALKS